MSKAYSNLSEIIFGDLFIRQDNTYNFRTNRVSNTNSKHILERF